MGVAVAVGVGGGLAVGAWDDFPDEAVPQRANAGKNDLLFLLSFNSFTLRQSA